MIRTEAVNDVIIYELLLTGLYKVDNGILYTKLAKNGKSVKDEWRKCGGANTQGYKVLNVRCLGGQKCIFIHRMIYAYYNKWLDPLKTIHHKNHKRWDNRIGNLMEVSLEGNNGMKKRVIGAKTDFSQIMTRHMGNNMTISELSKYTGISRVSLNNIKKGKQDPSLRNALLIAEKLYFSLELVDNLK